MNDISNKAIVALLAVALAVTAFGTTLSIVKLNQFDQLKDVYQVVTGAATTTGTGTSTITIAQATSLTNQVSSIAFGSGYTNSSCGTSGCVMDSDGKQNQTTAGTNFCCVAFTGVSSGFLLENTGNVNLSVNYSCSGSCLASQFIGGTSPFFGIRVLNNSNADQSGEAGAADSTDSCSGAGAGGLNRTQPQYSPIAVDGFWLCGNYTAFDLDYEDSGDALVVDLNVTIPTDAPTGGGLQTATFTFEALATG